MRARYIKLNVYGRWLYKPDNDLAQSFCTLIRRKTLSDRHIKDLEKLPIDFEIEVVPTKRVTNWIVTEQAKEG